MDRVEIVDRAIEADDALRGLAGPGDGAIALFVGVVREEDEGRRVRRLEYHAYPEMAEQVLRRIAADVRQRFAASAVTILHRVGSLEVGEVSVAVAVACAHRGPAFAACRHAIERLKHEAPIWKKEHFDGGSAWARGCRSEDRDPSL